MNSHPPLDPRLEAQLQSVARELRAVHLHRLATYRWLITSAVVVGLVTFRSNFEGFAPFLLPALIVVFLAALVRSFLVARRLPLDCAAAARVVETEYPDLKQALRTAAEQTPGATGGFNFLQQRVIGSALQHGWRHNWAHSPSRRARQHLGAHVAALAFAAALAALPFTQTGRTLPWLRAAAGVVVTPGNAEIERGNSVIVAARLSGRPSRNVTLRWQAGAKSGETAMTRSLSDPVYVFTLPSVTEDVTYSVRHDGGETTRYRLTVFDQPALQQADATLDYPAFTGLPEKKIADTRHLSAVTGTKVSYEFMVNKPLQSASLQDAGGKPLALVPANPEHTRFTANLTVDQNRTYTLKLVDNQGRTNPAPTTISIVALENKRPTLTLQFPRDDQRVSPIEEVKLQATAAATFGLRDYGIAFSVGAQEPQYVSLDQADAKGKAAVKAAFEKMLALEPLGVKPNELVTWFAWADDFGDNGQLRRTASDLYFAEVRPFEEIYREDANGGGQRQQQQQQNQPQGQNPGNNPRLLELQRQISIAIWKLRQQDKPGKDFATDVATLHDSQKQAQDLLATAQAALENPTQVAAAAEAARFMAQAETNLAAAGKDTKLDPLTPAWSGAQGAYQALLQMQAREFRVAQQRGQPGQQQQQRERNQDQLDQLRFQQQQNRYETENTPQVPTTPEQREQLQAQSRLRELARRQQDVNQRLQEMQTALNAATDEQQREQIRRELKRLEDEQRSMLADLDQVRQRVDQLAPGDQTQQARLELDQARDNMRKTSDQLAQNQVSQALAAGTRANQALENTREDLRRDTANRFADQMRTARQEARDLAQRQQETADELSQLAKNGAGSLDDDTKRQQLAQTLDTQRANLTKLLDQLTQVAEDSDGTEPGLHKQVYDLVRQESQSSAPSQLQTGSELLRRGFVDQSRELQTNVAQDFNQLRIGVERAAESVLGDDTAALRFAQNELDDLSRQLRREQSPADAQAEAAAGERGAPSDRSAAANPDGTGQRGGPNSEQTASNETGAGQRGANGQPSGNNGQPDSQGQPAGGAAQDFQRGQPGGQDGLAQDGSPGQGGQPGAQGQRNGQGQTQGQRQGGQGQGSGQRGNQGGQQPGDGQQVAQDDQGGQPGGGQGQRQGGQGQRAGQGQGQGQVQRQGAGRGQGGQPGQPGEEQAVAQNDAQGQGGQPGGQGGQRGGQGGQRGGQPGQAGANGRAGQGQRGGAQGGAGGVGQLANNGPRAGGGGMGGPGGAANNQGGGGALGGVDQLIQDLAGPGGNTTTGPITGANFAEWADRLRTVEELVDSPQLRQQLANARGRAEDLRRDYQRHSQLPQWGDVADNILAPLNAVRLQLRQELARHDEPASLQPVDRDPVPEKYADSVRNYYEALGN